LPDRGSSPVRCGPRRGRFSVWLGLVIGLVLLIAGIGQSVSAIEIFLAISQTMSASEPPQLSVENPAPDDRKIHGAPRWAEAQDLFLLAWAKNRLLASRESSKARAALLESATSDAKRAVENAPGYSPGWLMLADLRREAGAPAGDVAKLLKISILTAPFDPYRVHGRLVVGFSIYSSLDEDGRDLLATQIRMAWRHAPEDLVKLALTPDRVDHLFLIRLALAADSSALKEFEKLVARMR
jgi:hypothetical protein